MERLVEMIDELQKAIIDWKPNKWEYPLLQWRLDMLDSTLNKDLAFYVGQNAYGGKSCKTS